MSRTALVFATSTDVGKSIASAGLLRAARRAGCSPLYYVKPVQTGPVTDEAFIRSNAPVDVAVTLFAYPEPLSPHVAARRGAMPTTRPPTGREIREALSKVMAPAANSATSFTLVETAGGVLSPSPDGTLQADVLRLSRLPAVVVGDGRLGGISNTLMALEALLSRQYSVAAVLLFADDADEARLGNAAFLREQLPVPVRRATAVPSEGPLEGFYGANAAVFDAVLNDVLVGHPERGQVEP